MSAGGGAAAPLPGEPPEDEENEVVVNYEGQLKSSLLHDPRSLQEKRGRVHEALSSKRAVNGSYKNAASAVYILYQKL